jgi:hypothetical protein
MSLKTAISSLILAGAVSSALESLMAAIAIGDEEAKARINAFFEKRVPKVAPLFGQG